MTQKKIDDLKPDTRNANRGTETGKEMLVSSIKKYGAGRSVLLDKNDNIIAGNKTVEGAREAGYDDVIVVETDGTKLVAVKRTDIDLYEDQTARELAYADNRIGQINLNWDADIMAADILQGVNLSSLFSETDLKELGVSDGDIKEDQDKYTSKIKAPTYEPTGEKPAIRDLYDCTKTIQIINEINSVEGISDEEKQFLLIAAQRHTILRFDRIAEYYAQSEKPMQLLMENSALVIIDFSKAIELGYVELSKRIAEIFESEYGSG